MRYCILLAAILCMSCTPVFAQGTDLFNRPLPDTITYDFYQSVIAIDGISTAEDVNPGGTHDNWLACGASIAAYRTAFYDADGKRYTAVLEKESCEAELQACRGENAVSDQRLGKVLWKPVSDGGGSGFTGNLVVLTDEAGIEVTVEGDVSETLSNGTPSAGYGTVARSRNRGCSFGLNVIVSFHDNQGRLVLTKDGDQAVIIPNGCNRSEQKF